MFESHPAFSIPSASSELRSKVEEAGWPDGLLDRILALRRDHDEIHFWVDTGHPPPDMLLPWVEMQEQMLNTTLVARQATWEDSSLLVELCDNSPETVGKWTVTVQRSPNPYAQMRLQEHPSVILIEDQRVGLGMGVHSSRNTIIDGEKTTAHQMSGWRIRDGFRGLGLSRVLQTAAGPGAGWFGLCTYWFVRTGNASSTWISKVVADIADRPEEFQAGTEASTASVAVFGRPELGRSSARVRPATAADAEACRALINRTHDGLDLFRPYSEDYFDQRMCDPSWGPKPFFHPEVYGLADHRVLEIDGKIVACGGLWDRGRDLREVWVNGEERSVVDPAALLDFGFADGQEAAMAELISHLVAEAAELGRSGLLAPLEFLPEVSGLLEDLAPTADVRELHVMGFSSPDLTVEFSIRRPYIDLAYW